MSRRLLAVLLAVPLMIMIGGFGVLDALVPRAAASCIYDTDDPALITSADVIFTGEIVANQTAKLGREREYTFRVAKVFKGAAYSEQLVATDNRSSAALTVEGPGTFLVLANFGSGDTEGPVTRLFSNGCSGTRLVTQADGLPATLGPGQDPAIGSSRSVTSRFTGKLWIAGGLACFAAAIVINRRAARRRNREQP